MIDKLLVQLIKGLPSVKSLFLERDTGKVVPYEENVFVIVERAPVEKGKHLVVISVKITNTSNGTPLIGGPTPHRIAAVTIGVYCAMMDEKGNLVTNPEEDKAYKIIQKGIESLDRNVELFWEAFKFDIESIEVDGPIQDESDEQKNHHKFEYDLVIKYKTTNIPTSN